MAMLKTDKLIAAPRGTFSETIAYFDRFGGVLRWTDFVDYVGEVFRTAPRVGLDPSIVIAQASHETGNFTSYWWLMRLNPAGLGITGVPSQNDASRTFQSGNEAAYAHLAHLQLYATGKISWPLEPSDDPRYDAYVTRYGQGVAAASTIEDLSSSWASSSTYHESVCRHGNWIFKALPDSSVYVVPPIIVRSGASPIRDESGKLWNGTTNIVMNGILFRGSRQVITVADNTLNVRKYADISFKPLTNLPPYAKVEVIGWTIGSTVDGENRWWIGADHTRMWVGGTVEKPS